MGDGTTAHGDEHEHARSGQWRKSSYSLTNGHCVEVSCFAGGRLVGVRDSSAVAGGPVLRLQPAAWRALVSSLRVASLVSD
jgi:hypothetical protein